ncbi:MAG: hypothetical protein ACRYGF_08820 [Janthinobacterium lividum]
MAQAFTQNSEQYVAHIDAEIERLQRLRNQVSEAIEGEKQIAAPRTTGGGMSAEGRLRVAEAQKARWAKQKKAAKKAAKAVVTSPVKKTSATKTVAKKSVKKAAPEASPDPAV